MRWARELRTVGWVVLALVLAADHDPDHSTAAPQLHARGRRGRPPPPAAVGRRPRVGPGRHRSDGLGRRPRDLSSGDAARRARGSLLRLPVLLGPAADRAGAGGDGLRRLHHGLDAAGIAHAGSARSPDEAAAITLLDAAGVRVALLSYSFGFNGIAAPRGEEWRSNRIDEVRILDAAARARTLGAEVVVVALHWGDEYRSEPNAQQQDLAPRLIASPDVDLLLGHHAHVVQPVEAFDGEWVVYGMGNMLAHQETPGDELEEGLLVRFTFTETPQGFRATDAAYTVVLAERDRSPLRLVDVGLAPSDPRTEAAWTRTTATVDRRAASAAGRVWPFWQRISRVIPGRRSRPAASPMCPPDDHGT